MNGAQISSYWQAYLDLIELWAKGIWDEADLASHFKNHGQAEGRRITDGADAAKDWSDWHYFKNSHDHYQWWWHKGVIDSGVYAALVEGDAAMQRGCVSRDAHIQKITAMSQTALEQLVENGQDHPGNGPLAAVSSENMQWGAQKSIGLLPLTDALTREFSGRFGYVIVLPWLESGGAELVGLWHYLAARELGLEPLIILADKPDVTERFLAHDLNILNLPELYAKATGNQYNDLTKEDRTQVLTATIEVIQPRTLHLIHSFIGYSALSDKPLKTRIRAACETIFVSAFCPHIHAPGNFDGYFRYIPEIHDIVDKFVFDNDWYLREMQMMYQLPARQTTALKYPIDRVKPVKATVMKRPKVLWASRFDSQKNPQIVADIARHLPELDFVMYGRRVLGDVEIDWQNMPDNVTDGGEFFNIDALPFKECFAFLYTSKFDGTPNILMEIASRGLPIVTANIGGIAGFLGDEWPEYISNPEDVQGYVASLKRLNKDCSHAKKLLDIQSKILKNERSFKAFVAAKSALVTASYT